MKFIAALLCIYITACSSPPINENDPQQLYEAAEKDIDKKKYLQALDRLKIIKNRFPYHHLSTQAALKIADVFFLQESYIEAAATYETFQDLHPKHEKADYVVYQIAQSYDKQTPSSVDRDLAVATKALDSYLQLKSLFPKSSYLEPSEERIVVLRRKLFEKELYIARFYKKTGHPESAAQRFENILNTYDNQWPVPSGEQGNAAFAPHEKKHVVLERIECLEKAGKTKEAEQLRNTGQNIPQKNAH